MPVHLAAGGYSVQRFLDDPAYLSRAVRFDLPLLGDVAGLQAVHLQCHIGTDTVSLARLGASATGLDFSGPAVAAATELALATGADATFVRSDVYAAAEVLPARGFDLVYVSLGALCWLPDIRSWARVVAGLLKPGGRLFVRDSHPMLAALEDARGDGLICLKYSYFEQPEPQVWDDDSTYVASDVRIVHGVTHQWNHGIGEVVTAVIGAGMTVTGLAEHDSVPWNALPGLMTQAGGEWRLAEQPQRLAASFTLRAVRTRD